MRARVCGAAVCTAALDEDRKLGTSLFDYTDVVNQVGRCATLRTSRSHARKLAHSFLS